MMANKENKSQVVKLFPFPSWKNTHMSIYALSSTQQLPCCCQTLTKCFKTPPPSPNPRLPSTLAASWGERCHVFSALLSTPLCFQKERRKWVFDMHPCVPAGHRGKDIFRALGGCMYECAHVGSWMCVKKSKKGNKSWMQRGTTRGSPGVKRQEVS